MSILETLGILFIAIIALNALIGILAMKNAVSEETMNGISEESFGSLKVSKAHIR